MPNIQLSCLYRDRGNYKTFGFVIFANNVKLSLEHVNGQIQEKLIDKTWFYAEQWKLPLLYNDLSIGDPTWHEFECVKYTEMDGEIDIIDFLKMLADT